MIMIKRVAIEMCEMSDLKINEFKCVYIRTDIIIQYNRTDDD